MRLLRRILLSLPIILLLLVVAVWVALHSDFFWHWAGGKLVTLAEGECRCAVKVGSIEGNAFDGLFFKNIAMVTTEGEVIRAKSLEVKISFWSLFRLSPLISMLAINEPYLDIHQEKDGEWNIIKILPPPPKELPVNIVKVRFDHIKINHGAGRITLSGQTREFSDLDVDTDLDLENPVTPNQAIKVGKALAGVTTPFGRVDLNSRFSYAKNYLVVEHIIATSEGKRLLSLAGKGNMAPGGEFEINGKLDLPPEDIHRVWAKWPSTWDFATKFQVQGTRSQFNLALNGKVQEVNFDVTGAVGSKAGTWQYDLKGLAKHLTPDLLTIFDRSLALKLDKVGPVDTKFHVQGTGLSFPPDKFSWNLETEPFEYGTARMDQLKVNLAGNKESQQFLGSLTGPLGDLSLEASGALFTGKQGKFCLNLNSFKPAPLGLKVPEGTIITATVGGNFSSPGLKALDRLQVDVELVANGQIGQHPLNDAYIKALWSKNELKISQGSLRLGNVSADLHGAMVGNKVDFSFTGSSSREGNWPIPSKVGGQFSWEGTVTGSLSDPLISLKARGQELAYEKYGLKNVTLNAQISGWPPSKGRINFQAKGVRTPVGAFSQATFQSDGSGKLWNFDLKANGREKAKVAVRGSADFSRSSISIGRAYFNLDNLKAENRGPVEIVYSPGIEVKPATFSINKGKVSLQVSITENQATGSLNLQDLPTDLVLPQSLLLKGVISAQANLSGTARQPVIQGSIHLEPGHNQGFALQSVQTTFDYQENRLSLNGSLRTKEKGPGLTWSGQIPVRLSLLPFAFAKGQGGIQVVLKGENLNLSLLPQLARGVENAQGAIDLQVKVEGTMSNPQVAGRVGWGEGSIKLRATGANYQLLPGSIKLQGNRITIPQLTLQSEGTATLTGDIDLAGYAPADVRGRLQFNNFKAIDKLKSEAFLNGAINLGGKWPKLAVTGDLTIPKASFTLSFLNVGPTTVNKDVILVGQEPPEKTKTGKGKKHSVATGLEVWKDLRMDMRIRASRDVKVDDPHAKIEVAMNIAVRKQPGQELVSSGEIRSRHGQVFIAGRNFQVTRGVVTLPPQPGAEPVVNGRIEYDTSSDVILYAEVNGPVSNPKITLGGEPAISQTDWMAYLLYGKPVAYLSQEQQSSVSAAGAFGGLAARVILKDLLGMAPSFTKGLSISYQQPSDPLYREDPYQVVINYRINRRISVQSQVGGRNSGGDVLFNFDF
jgi:autotransporter translocation and assembly factor TamB